MPRFEDPFKQVPGKQAGNLRRAGSFPIGGRCVLGNGLKLPMGLFQTVEQNQIATCQDLFVSRKDEP